MTPDWTPPPPPLTPAENAVVWIDGMVELFGDGEALANLLNGTIIHPATYARIRDTYPATAKALGISPPLRCPFCDPPTREDVLAWDAGMRATPIALPPPMMACAKHAPMLQTPFATRYPIPTCKEHGEPWCNRCTLRAFQGDAVRICGAPVTTDARGTSTCARPSGHAGFHQLAGFTDEEPRAQALTAETFDRALRAAIGKP